jgi:hypothetical protein
MAARSAAGFSAQKILLIGLFLTALAVSLAEAFYIDQPGMMDACYYYSGGLNISRGKGWSEYFLWNYLDESAGVPHSSFAYWMPFPSVLAGLGMILFGKGFRQAQIPFLILASGFPFLVFWIGRQLTGSFRISILAGFLAVFSGFYTVYWTNTESFLIYAWIGGLFIGLYPRMAEASRWAAGTLLIGILCGVAHLTRADGILFLALAGLLILGFRSVSLSEKIQRLMLMGAGYLAVCGFWYCRNLDTWGSLFPPGTGKTLWFTEYNDLFLFPSSKITVGRFFSGGFSQIISARGNALLFNTLTVVFVAGLIFLFPLICYGVFLLRREARIRTALIYFSSIFLLMTIVYPFAGPRGGFLHSSAALLPVAAAAASTGLDGVIERLARWRNWEPVSARNVLGAGTAVLALFASAAVFHQRVVGSNPARTLWDSMNAEYPAGISRLGGDLPDSTLFMVNTPPCFYAQTGFSAVPVPAGTPTMLMDAADRFGVDYIILDSNTPEGLLSLFQGTASLPRLRRIFAEEYDGVGYVWFQVLPP